MPQPSHSEAQRRRAYWSVPSRSSNAAHPRSVLGEISDSNMSRGGMRSLVHERAYEGMSWSLSGLVSQSAGLASDGTHSNRTRQRGSGEDGESARRGGDTGSWYS